MRILHILPSSYTGGVAQVVYDLCVAQREAGHNVTLFLLRNDPRYHDNTGRFETLGVKTIVANLDRLYDPRHIIGIRKAMKKADIVHVHLFPEQLYAAIAKLLIPRKCRPIVLTTEHSTYNNRRGKIVFRILDRLFYTAYDRIVCISPMTEQLLRNWLVYSRLCRKIVTIVNGVDIEKFGMANNSLDKVVPVSVDRSLHFVIMVARLTPPKDPITFLRAIALCPQSVHGVFVGDGSLSEKIQEEASRLCITNRVHLLGARVDVPNLLKGCSIGVLSTQWDGFGLVAVEYMASGLPVVVTDVDGLREVVDDNDCLFNYRDAESLAVKIRRLISDKTYYEAKRSRGLERCKAFSVEIMRQKYMALYDELMNAKNKNNKC